MKSVLVAHLKESVVNRMGIVENVDPSILSNMARDKIILFTLSMVMTTQKRAVPNIFRKSNNKITFDPDIDLNSPLLF